MLNQGSIVHRATWNHPKGSALKSTDLPDDACTHQRQADLHDQRARCGLKLDGSLCCEDAKMNHGFAAKNHEDKGTHSSLESNLIKILQEGQKGSRVFWSLRDINTWRWRCSPISGPPLIIFCLKNNFFLASRISRGIALA